MGREEGMAESAEAQCFLSRGGERFGDALSMTYHDPDHSQAEDRFIKVGMSRLGRALIVAHTNRGDSIRIISARKVTHRERTVYEEGI